VSFHPLFTSAEEYHAFLIEQADEQVERLAGKVAKAERHLDDAHAAHAAAVTEAERLHAGDLPEFVLPTSSVRASVR
jgi:hypothetical protein